jgi:hypothetical protein
MKVSIEFDPSKAHDRKILYYILSTDEQSTATVEQLDDIKPGNECVCTPETTTKRKGGRPSNAEKARRREEETVVTTPTAPVEASVSVEATVSAVTGLAETNVTGLFDALRRAQASAGVQPPEDITTFYPPGVFAPKTEPAVVPTPTAMPAAVVPTPTAMPAAVVPTPTAMPAAVVPTPTAMPHVPHVHIESPTGIVPLELFREAMQQANNRAPGKPFVLLKSPTWPDGSPKKMWFNAESVDPDLREKVMELWALS